MAKTKLATIQMNSSDEIDSNLEQAEHWIKLACEQEAKLVALPENFAYMGRESEKIQQLHSIQNKTQDFLSRIAKEYKIYLLGGGYPSLSPDSNRAYNTASIYSPDGTEVFHYNKIHLFDTNPGDGIQYTESKTVFPGAVVPTPIEVYGFGRIASIICYDLRFPELFRKISEQKVNIIFVPSAFTELTGKAHWEVLLRARAIENFVYIVAPAQTGTHTIKENSSDAAEKSISQTPTSTNKTPSLKKTFGHSLVVSPWGEILSDGGEQVGYSILEIDTNDVDIYRKKIPSLSHRTLF
ncbi:MAG: carbon-nitrogen hydrolase family protein [Leptospira sp.]|jgi:deaminated glutathione amidase|nr:carbon-nitrogen hydrolase family protein [Leptospira sp.]NCS95596.1 carbon-nitrogen hydrolase family protein [Leptospira sp.]